MIPTLSLVHLARPATATGEDDRPPLLLLLHGVGANERQMAAIAAHLDPRFLVLSIRSPLALGREAYGWFHVTFTPRGPQIGAEEAAAGWQAIARFADEAVAAYGADPRRVYVGGFSQGGIMALAALLTAPERFAGAICMSGRLLPEVLPLAAGSERLRSKPVLIVHGTHDETLGIQFARWAREQLETMPLVLTYRELPMGHEVSGASLDEVAGWLTAQLEAEVAA
jgi:phospholipase/carboxylesterase